MSMEWATAFDGPLAEYARSATGDRIRIPWPAIEDADRDLADLVLEDPRSAIAAAEDELADRGREKAVRIYDLPKARTYRVGKYGSAMLGQLIGIQGRVVSVDGVKPFAEVAAFECRLCGTMNRMSQPGGKLVKPFQCQGCEDNTSEWALSVEHSDIADFQQIVLKRTDSSMDDPPIETVYLWDDLCETVSTDDVVTIVGVYDTLPWPDEAVLKTYVDAVSINKSEQPATVDEVADWRVKEWTFEAADELCQRGSKYDCAKRDVIDYVSNEHGVADGEVTAALADLESMSYISERQSGRIHITTSSTPSFEPAE